MVAERMVNIVYKKYRRGKHILDGTLGAHISFSFLRLLHTTYRILEGADKGVLACHCVNVLQSPPPEPESEAGCCVSLTGLISSRLVYPFLHYSILLYQRTFLVHGVAGVDGASASAVAATFASAGVPFFFAAALSLGTLGCVEMRGLLVCLLARFYVM